MADNFRLMARWSSNHDCIWAKINGKTICALHKWSDLPQVVIRHMKVKSVRMIASFDSNANDLSLQFISKVNYLINQWDLSKSDLWQN